MRPILLTCLALAAAAQVSAQTSKAAKAAAATITEADVRQRIGVIAHDSMGGRDTPSRGLDLTAQYVADAFRRFGLKPGGDDGSFLQSYWLEKRRLDAAASSVSLSSGGVTSAAAFGSAAIFASGTVHPTPVNGPVLLLAGKVDAQSLAGAPIKDHVVIIALPDGSAGRSRGERGGQRARVLPPCCSSSAATRPAFAERAGGRTRPRTVSAGRRDAAAGGGGARIGPPAGARGGGRGPRGGARARTRPWCARCRG